VAPTREGIHALMRVEDERAARYAAQFESLPEQQTVNAPKVAKHCGAGSSGIAIDPYGNIYPCVQWRRAAANLHETSISAIWGFAFDEFRQQTVEAKGVVAAHPRGRLLNFCPGLADVLTGSATRVPEEMERVAEILATS
jgi:MoaA/NifB/PqqE/SkfB family radical SAM enzyme